MLNEITLQSYCLTSWFTSYQVGYFIRRSIKFDVHNDNNETPTTAYCQYWLVIVYVHIPVFSMLYTYLIRQWRIIGVYIILYSTQRWWILITSSSTCYTSKITSYMSLYAKNKTSISGNFSGRCLYMKCASLFIQNILFFISYAKHIFLYMQNYMFCTSICFRICKSIYLVQNI